MLSWLGLKVQCLILRQPFIRYWDFFIAHQATISCHGTSCLDIALSFWLFFDTFYKPFLVATINSSLSLGFFTGRNLTVLAYTLYLHAYDFHMPMKNDWNEVSWCGANFHKCRIWQCIFQLNHLVNSNLIWTLLHKSSYFQYSSHFGIFAWIIFCPFWFLIDTTIK